MLTVLARRPCRVRARPDPGADRRRPRAGESARREDGPQAEAHPAPAARGAETPRQRRAGAGDRPQLQCPPRDDFEACCVISGDTWAIVAATVLGPIFAVAITFWRKGRNSLKTRRLWVFRTLMATRRVFSRSFTRGDSVGLVATSPLYIDQACDTPRPKAPEQAGSSANGRAVAGNLTYEL